jgi:hypothetical protein
MAWMVLIYLVWVLECDLQDVNRVASSAGIWGQDKIIKYFCDEWLLQNKRIYRVEFTPDLP